MTKGGHLLFRNDRKVAVWVHDPDLIGLNRVMSPRSLHFGEFEAFEVFFFEYGPGFSLVLFYCLLEFVPVGFFVCFAVFPCIGVDERVPAG